MSFRKILIFVLIFVPLFLTQCNGKSVVKFKKAGEKIQLNFRANTDSTLLIYRIYSDTISHDTAIFIKNNKGRFGYEIKPDSNVNLIEYYIEDMNGNRYPDRDLFYAIFFRKNGKVLKNAYFNYTKDLYKSGIRDFDIIVKSAKKELKNYPDNYAVYNFLDNIKYNIPNFNIRLSDMYNMAKKGTPGFFRVFTVIMSRYNMKKADSLFEVMLSKKIKPYNMTEYFARASRDTSYIDSVTKKFPKFKYDIYKNCFIASAKYKIFKNFNYYKEKVLAMTQSENDPDIYRAVILSGRGNLVFSYEKLKKLKKTTPYITGNVAEKLITSNNGKLKEILKDMNAYKYPPRLLNGISYDMAIHGTNLKLAEKFILIGLKSFTVPYSFAGDFLKPFYKKKYDYYTNLAYMLDTYAFILIQEDDYNHAKTQLEKAIENLSEIGEEDPTILEHYAFVMEREKVPDDSLITLYGKILSYGKNDDILEKLHKIYVKEYGNDNNFKKYTERLKRKYRALKRTDREVKNYAIRDINNRKYNILGFKGKLVIITFFKTECGFCKAEAYDLRRLQEKFKGSKSVVFVDITSDNRRDALAFSKRYKLNAITVAGRMDLLNKFEIVGTPTNVIIGTDGRIHYILTGYFTDFRDMINEIIKNELNID